MILALDELAGIRHRAVKFMEEATKILEKHESSKLRIIDLQGTRKKLTGLSLLQHDLFTQALDCIEHSLNRPAHVMAWAGYIDLLEEKLASDGLVKLKVLRPAWAKHVHQLIEAAKELQLISKAAMKALHGLLSKRNECAHPSSYRPNLNETLGYVSELLNRADDLSTKSL